jgi:LacI family transcriptional regulator
MLDCLMEGKPLKTADVLVPPEGVVQRASTAIDAIEDPVVAAAVHYIREHAGEPIDVHDVVRVVPRSRRWLEQGFRDCLGVSPHEYLCRTRLQRAQALLTDPRKWSLKEVAAKCGFHESRRLRIAFQRYLGLTPAAYRRQHAAR